MISIFARKNDLRMRQDILKGVYEENRLILGKGTALSKRRPMLKHKILFSIIICILAVLVQSQYGEITFTPHELTAQTNIQNLSSPAIGPSGTPNPSELSTVMNSGTVPLSRMFGLKIRTIMIDAGHGGADSGSIGKMGTMEKDITIDIAKKLQAILVSSGRFRVLMTREGDTTVPLQKRVEMARSAKADIFISVHLNYLPKKPINIIETYYFGPSNDEKVLRLAEQENAGSEYGLSDFKEIMEKLGKTMKLQESREFAQSIQSKLYQNSRKQNAEIQNFGVKRAPFVVLLGVDVPAVLAEVSCLSNHAEEKELLINEHRENIARYLADGIYDYLNKGDLTHEAKR